MPDRRRILGVAVDDLAQAGEQVRTRCRRSPRCGPGGARAGAPGCRPDPRAPARRTAVPPSPPPGGRCRAAHRPRWLTAGTAVVLSRPLRARRMTRRPARALRARWCRTCRTTRPPSAADRSPSASRAPAAERTARFRPVPAPRAARLKCSVAGTFPARSDMIALISPTAPAADSVWPTLLLTEPTAHAPVVP